MKGARAWLFALMFVAAASHAAMKLIPVASGLSSPVFVTNAGDGSNRLFVVEQEGAILVRQPSGTMSTFLDVRSKVSAGGERGLLGLAFHPQFVANGRFFVYYTRGNDGAIVIAEYHVSSNANVADSAEKVLLVIPHPVNANHNGGMLAFGPDHLLYAGVGDGGSGNDPPNNAQNLDVLLGKILRIDVDRTDAAAGTPYAIPAGNPFINAAGRDEIFAYGMRNPWRFSFDRVTGVQWVADVGQGAREEVDMPIVAGGNYGWRVYEGFSCTGNDPTRCDPSRYRFPIFDYDHSKGRCSITGGYVYRGNDGTVPGGTYLYGDYCSSEIFAWDGSHPSVLLSTGLNLSSFGEDEQGEIYVTAVSGTVNRLAGVTPCAYTISPTRQTFAKAGGAASVALSTNPTCTWTAQSSVSWIAITSTTSGSGSATLTYSVAGYSGKEKTRVGTIAIADQTLTIMQNRLRPLVRPK